MEAASEEENQNQNNEENNNNNNNNNNSNSNGKINNNNNSSEGQSKPKRQMKTPFQLETLEKAYSSAYKFWIFLPLFGFDLWNFDKFDEFFLGIFAWFSGDLSIGGDEGGPVGKIGAFRSAIADVVLSQEVEGQEGGFGEEAA